MSLVADLARDGIQATVEPAAGGLWNASLCRRDGSLFVRLQDADSQAAAEAWLLANAETTYPNCYAARRHRGAA